jgi:alanine-synthesizing transaminase
LGYHARVFSARTRWDLTANRLTELLAEKRRRGARVLDLTESNPTRAALVAPCELLGALADPAGLSYEPSPSGLAAAREAVAGDFRRRGIEVAAERLILTSSTSEAYAFLFKLLCDPGDAVLVPRPSYPLFEYLARLESVEVGAYPLVYDGDWHVDLGALCAALSEHPRTRALVVVHPNNPTGSYVKRDEAAALHELCSARSLAIVADEVFADYSFAPDPRRLPSFASDGPALTFALGGLSKSCGLPQMKLAWIATAGPQELRARALERLEVIADTFLSVSTPVQVAAPAWLAQAAALRAPIAERVRANLAALRECSGSGSAATVLTVEGGWYAVLHVPATLPEEERVLRLLDERDVLVHPGFFFDFPSEAYLVLSLLAPAQVFREGARRIVAAA